ncbi:TadE/TadG family type IV pilus assembly protein [Gemmobacter lutimaris]|uniref:TadE/TadG family type IV pilus assembly protein n=1 Tax=Gemmobacter lutimaris TaxID=2306023 RepID=UPI0011C3E66B|nr:hypothetical protein [Gemmobacter lutimaris]
MTGRSGLLGRLRARLRRFGHEEDGTALLVEGMLLMPLLIWAAFGLYVYWDAFRTINQVQKATYTASDALSRLERNASFTYVNGLSNAMTYLTNTEFAPIMRYTSVVWVAARNRYEVQWSCSMNRSKLPPWTTATLQTVATKLPISDNAQTLILVESDTQFRPALNIGLNDFVIKQFVATKPRFVTQVGFNDIGNCN